MESLAASRDASDGTHTLGDYLYDEKFFIGARKEGGKKNYQEFQEIFCEQWLKLAVFITKNQAMPSEDDALGAKNTRRHLIVLLENNIDTQADASVIIDAVCASLKEQAKPNTRVHQSYDVRSRIAFPEGKTAVPLL